MEQIFGFEPPEIQPETKTKPRRKGGSKEQMAKARAARAAKAANKAADETVADVLEELAEKRRTRAKKATPKDYDQIKGMQKNGMMVDEIAEVTGFTKESVMKLINDTPYPGAFNSKYEKVSNNYSQV